MALINCPECGKEISDKSETCIHCGFPLIRIANTKCEINGTIYDFEKEFQVALLPTIGEYSSAYNMISRKTRMCSADACKLVKIVRWNKAFPESYTPEYALLDPSVLSGSTVSSNSVSVVKCPYCNSGNTKRISITSKAVNTALFGMFSVSRNSKNYHCNSCGADF
ncbi:MAG: zinc-ribbon domain-containing protein [Lachnospiraceae bacterium]|nr:zinc-ribbon domain-containing protein [Lachnospiraceae bacterium]